MDSSFPMHKAAAEGDLERVQHCIEKGMSVDSLDNNNYTPLEWAAQCGHLDIVKFLICQTTDLNLKPYIGYRAVLFAAESGCKDVVDLLLHCGAETNGCSGRGRWTVLHHSSSRGWTDTVEWILKNRNADLDARTTLEMTPLMLAASEGHLSVVDLLVVNGADVNCRDADSWTALHYASKRGWLEVAKSIAGDCDLKAKNSSGKTPLDIACGMNNLEISEELLTAGAFQSAKDGDIEGLKCLLEQGESLDILDLRSYTPLHYAAERGHLEVVRFLVSNHCNLNLKNCEGETAMLSASFSSCKHTKEVIDLLIESGGDVTCSEDVMNTTILHHAAKSDWTDTIQHILKNKVNVNAKGIHGYTPLMYAAMGRGLNAAKLLLQYDANVNCCDDNGKTALHIVCEGYYDTNIVELVKTLLMAGADPNLKADDTKTAFHYAVTREQPNVEIIQLLIQHGAYFSDSDIELDY